VVFIDKNQIFYVVPVDVLFVFLFDFLHNFIESRYFILIVSENPFNDTLAFAFDTDKGENLIYYVGFSVLFGILEQILVLGFLLKLLIVVSGILFLNLSMLVVQITTMGSRAHSVFQLDILRLKDLSMLVIMIARRIEVGVNW
jgi:hypothetical protein